eukprot:jgi/Mesen1/9517/ME000637S08972
MTELRARRLNLQREVLANQAQGAAGIGDERDRFGFAAPTPPPILASWGRYGERPAGVGAPEPNDLMSERGSCPAGGPPTGVWGDGHVDEDDDEGQSDGGDRETQIEDYIQGARAGRPPQAGGPLGRGGNGGGLVRIRGRNGEEARNASTKASRPDSHLHGFALPYLKLAVRAPVLAPDPGVQPPETVPAGRLQMADSRGPRAARPEAEGGFRPGLEQRGPYELNSPRASGAAGQRRGDAGLAHAHAQAQAGAESLTASIELGETHAPANHSLPLPHGGGAASRPPLGGGRQQLSRFEAPARGAADGKRPALAPPPSPSPLGPGRGGGGRPIPPDLEWGGSLLPGGSSAPALYLGQHLHDGTGYGRHQAEGPPRNVLSSSPRVPPRLARPGLHPNEVDPPRPQQALQAAAREEQQHQQQQQQQDVPDDGAGFAGMAITDDPLAVVDAQMLPPSRPPPPARPPVPPAWPSPPQDAGGEKYASESQGGESKDEDSSGYTPPPLPPGYSPVPSPTSSPRRRREPTPTSEPQDEEQEERGRGLARAGEQQVAHFRAGEGAMLAIIGTGGEEREEQGWQGQQRQGGSRERDREVVMGEPEDREGGQRERERGGEQAMDEDDNDDDEASVPQVAPAGAGRPPGQEPARRRKERERERGRGRWSGQPAEQRERDAREGRGGEGPEEVEGEELRRRQLAGSCKASPPLPISERALVVAGREPQQLEDLGEADAEQVVPSEEPEEEEEEGERSRRMVEVPASTTQVWLQRWANRQSQSREPLALPGGAWPPQRDAPGPGSRPQQGGGASMALAAYVPLLRKGNNAGSLPGERERERDGQSHRLVPLGREGAIAGREARARAAAALELAHRREAATGLQAAAEAGGSGRGSHLEAGGGREAGSHSEHQQSYDGRGDYAAAAGNPFSRPPPPPPPPPPRSPFASGGTSHSRSLSLQRPAHGGGGGSGHLHHNNSNSNSRSNAGAPIKNGNSNSLRDSDAAYADTNSHTPSAHGGSAGGGFLGHSRGGASAAAAAAAAASSWQPRAPPPGPSSAAAAATPTPIPTSSGSMPSSFSSMNKPPAPSPPGPPPAPSTTTRTLVNACFFGLAGGASGAGGGSVRMEPTPMEVAEGPDEERTVPVTTALALRSEGGLGGTAAAAAAAGLERAAATAEGVPAGGGAMEFVPLAARLPTPRGPPKYGRSGLWARAAKERVARERGGSDGGGGGKDKGKLGSGGEEDPARGFNLIRFGDGAAADGAGGGSGSGSGLAIYGTGGESSLGQGREEKRGMPSAAAVALTGRTWINPEVLGGLGSGGAPPSLASWPEAWPWFKGKNPALDE